ncbi:MAG: hypothetical protein ACPGVN_03595 [Alphaproteobacteria bacterium]
MKSLSTIGLISVLSTGLVLSACSSSNKAYPTPEPYSAPAPAPSMVSVEPRVNQITAPAMPMEPSIEIAALPTPTPSTSQVSANTSVNSNDAIPMVDENFLSSNEVAPNRVITSGAVSVSNISKSAGNSGVTNTGQRSNLSIPVTGDDSFTTAATKAQAHCSQFGSEPGSPIMNTSTSGQQVLTYSCN